MQPCGRDALNSWDLVPFLWGAEMYTAMCTGRACFINLAFKVILLRRLADARRVQLLAVGHFTAGSGGDDQEALLSRAQPTAGAEGGDGPRA